MRAAIIGAGALGSLFGGILSQEDHEIWLYNPSNVAHIEAIQQSGLRIETPEGNLKVYPHATTSIKEIPKPLDLVGIFVKAYDTEEATQQALPLIDETTWVLSLQNGIGPEEMILRHLNQGQLLRGATSQGATFISPGIVKWGGLGPTKLGVMNGSGNIDKDRLERLCQEIGHTGWNCELADGIERLLWEKLVINVGINPLTALFDVPNGQLLKDAALRSVMHGLINEAHPIVLNHGVTLSRNELIEIVERVCDQTASNISSMLQDVRRKKRTEIEYISGAIVDEAKKIESPSPLNQLVMSLLMKP